MNGHVPVQIVLCGESSTTLLAEDFVCLVFGRGLSIRECQWKQALEAAGDRRQSMAAIRCAAAQGLANGV